MSRHTTRSLFRTINSKSPKSQGDEAVNVDARLFIALFAAAMIIGALITPPKLTSASLSQAQEKPAHAVAADRIG